nr:ribonuclease H-like domain-containing protein [Tanacetum cinerariifolium]
MPPKHDVFHDAPNVNETTHTAFNVELSPTNPDKDLSHTHRPLAPIIEDWVSDLEDDFETQIPQDIPSFVQTNEQVKSPRPYKHVIPTAVLTKSKLVPITAARPVTAAVLKFHVTRPRPVKSIVTKPHLQPRRHIDYSPSPKASNFLPKVIAVKGNPQHALKDKGVIDSRYSRHMTGNMSYLSDFEEINGGYVAFGGNPKGGKISRKVKIRTGKLDFDDVYFVKELKFNLFSVSQMCDKKNNVLFTDTECLVLSPEFKLPDENQVLLKVPRENNMYNVNLKNIVPSEDLTCLFAKATLDESNLWHRRLGHINFKTMNKLVKGNLVRGLPTNFFENDHTCVACKKDKQHRASCKTKLLCGMKGIKREFSVPRTPQQNSIVERKNRTLIEAARTMLADSLLPIPFWAEAVNTACYVQNRVLVTKPQNKTPYELLHGRTPSIGFMGPFGSPMTILNTLDPLGKFNGKVDEGFLVGYSNIDRDAAFDDKELGFEGRKPESEVYVSLSSSAQIKKHDDKTKREAKVPAVGKISTNSTNTFSVVGPSNATVSPTHRKSSYVDSSQLPDDPNRSELEDITYSNDEDIGAEADFTNLKTTITVSPIPTTRVHKDHHVTQIFGDLSLATQKRSMSRVAQDQGGLSQINNDDFHTCMFACFLSQEDPNREEGINYEEVFAPVARIEAIRLFLAYASFMGFMVYQMDVKSVFLYETIEEEVYVCQPLGFEDPDYPNKVYKVVKALYRLYQAPRAWYETLANHLLENGFQKGKIDQTLFIKRQKDGKSASTPIDTKKPLLKDPDVKRIFRYLKGKLHLGLWYPKDSPFNLVAYSDSDYAGASLDKKSTTRGCQILGCRLISWQCKKKTVVAISSTEAEYVAIASCFAQVLWIPNQLLDYGAQVGDLSSHTIKYSSPALTQKVFANIRMVGKGFSGVDTPLFEGVLMAQQVDESAAELNVDVVPDAGVANEAAAEVNVDVVPAARVKKLERRNKVKVSKLRRLKKVGTTQRIDTSDDTVMDDVSKQGRIIADMDADVDVTLKDIAKDVVVDAEIKESSNGQGRQAETLTQIYQIDLEHADKVLSMQDDEVEPAEL